MIASIRSCDDVMFAEGKAGNRGHRSCFNGLHLVCQNESSQIKLRVVIRAEAQDVAQSIMAKMGSPQRPDVSALGVERVVRGRDCLLANLTLIVIELLHYTRQLRVSNPARHNSCGKFRVG